MDIALLNVRIVIQKSEVIIDKIGNHKSSYSDFYSCYATVSGESGKESVNAGTTSDDSDISFTIRYCNKIKYITSTEFRVKFNDEIYNILLVDHMNYKKKSLKLKCKKVDR